MGMAMGMADERDFGRQHFAIRCVTTTVLHVYQRRSSAHLIMQHYRAGLHKRMLLAEMKVAYGYILGGKVDASRSADLHVYWDPDRGAYGYTYWDPDRDTEFEDPDNGCFDEAHAINCGAFPIAQLMLDEERPKIGPKRGFA